MCAVSRIHFVRQMIAVAVCVWTAILLCLQFSPWRVQTSKLSADTARSYTVPFVQEQASEVASADTSVQINPMQIASLPTVLQADPIQKQENDAFVQETSSAAALEPTHSHAKPQTQQPETQLKDALVPQTENTAQDTKKKQNNTAELQPSVSLPVLSASSVSDVGATTLRPLRFGAQVTTALPGEGQGVVYILTVTERGSIRYTLGYDTDGPFSEIGWKLTLYEEYDRLGNSGSIAYRMLNILSSNVATDSVTSSAIGVQPGTYRLVLEQNGKFSRNDVTVLADFTAEHDRESEPNDTPARYTELYAGYSMKGSSNKYATATDTDEDWYLFRMPYDGYAHYTFTHDAMDMISVGWQIFLYDAALNQLSFNNAAIAEGSVTGEQVGLAEGIYFICVKGRVHSTQDYTVKVDAVEADLYEHESNDTFADATPLVPGQTVTGMMNNRSQGIDYDMYAVQLKQGGSLKLVFRHDAIDEDEDGEVYIGWNISLFNADGEKLYSGVSDWKDTVNLSPEMGLAAGTYYVQIDSDNRYFTSVPYTVTVEHSTDSGFESEPNNTTDKADEAVIGRPVKGSLTQTGLGTDCDYFVFNVAKDMYVELTFSHTTVNLDRLGWLVTLTDADGNVFTPMDENDLPLTDENGGVVNQLRVNWNAESATAHYRLKAGDYFIRVDAGDYFSSETYTLVLKKK